MLLVLRPWLPAQLPPLLPQVSSFPTARLGAQPPTTILCICRCVCVHMAVSVLCFWRAPTHGLSVTRHWHQVEVARVDGKEGSLDPCLLLSWMFGVHFGPRWNAEPLNLRPERAAPSRWQSGRELSVIWVLLLLWPLSWHCQLPSLQVSLRGLGAGGLFRCSYALSLHPAACPRRRSVCALAHLPLLAWLSPS